MLYVRNKQRGIGLLELMLSLAIIAAIILMATRYFTQASEASKVTQSTEIIATLINASYKWVEGQPNFSDISIQKLVDDKILPPDWANKKDPWGKLLTLKPHGNNNQIRIIMDGAPLSACNSINDIMINQGVLAANCMDRGGYTAVYPAQDPYE